MTMDEERKYLEGLLKDRFNFFLVFASLIIAGIVTADSVNAKEEQLAYMASVVVSLFAWFAILRTNILVNRTLDLLPENHPYNQIIKGPILLMTKRANTYLIVVAPLAIILMFVVLLWSSIATYGLLVFCEG